MFLIKKTRSSNDFLGLSGVSKTLLIPLFCRFLEAKRLQRSRFVDHDAIRIVEALGGESVVKQLATKPFWMFSHQWVGNRTVFIDRWILEFLKQNRDLKSIQILNFGSGLCSRYERTMKALHTEQPETINRLKWFEIDLPQVENAWRKFYHESENRHFLAASILDLNKLNDHLERNAGDQNSKTIAILEGLLMYLDPYQVSRVFCEVLPTLKVTDVFFESMLSPSAKLAKLNNRFTGFDLTMKWDLAGSSEFDRLFGSSDGGYRIIDQKWVSPVAKVFHAKRIG